MATTSAKRVVERQTTMQELAMPAASSNFSSWTSTEISSGSECNDAEGLVDVLLEASCDPLLIHSEELVDAAVRRKPLQKLRALRQKELDLASYMARREMSPFQERLNAITILPNVVFCLYFILAGNWIRPALGHVEPSLSSLDDTPLSCFPPGTSSSLWSWFHIYHYLPSIPPPAVTAIWLGITLHAPFSFLYHYKYAHQFTDSTQRVSHWSRRMDHSAIHACSALFAYATSGSFKYFLVNLLFNADCIYRQFQTKVRPRQNQTRVFMSILAYTIPILNRGDLELFTECWFILFLSGYCFIAYPLRGWSHAVFHLIICFLPPLLMEAALDVPSSQPYLHVAAMCASQRSH